MFKGAAGAGVEPLLAPGDPLARIGVIAKRFLLPLLLEEEPLLPDTAEGAEAVLEVPPSIKGGSCADEDPALAAEGEFCLE